MNPYKVLGVPKNADTKDIKKAYKKLARKYHPDVNNETGADERFKEINEAWDVLSDPKKRQMYDNFGTTSFKGAPHPERDPFNFRGRGSPGGFGGGSVNVEDILGSIFGTDGPRRRNIGRDLNVTLELEPFVSFIGGKKRIRIQRQNGTTESLNVNIPAGVKDGGVLRLAGQGHPPIGGGPCGDLNVKLRIGIHPVLRRDNKDLEMDLPITIGEGVLGAQIRVPTVTGDINVRIPPGSTNGTRLRLKGRGIQSSPPGDLYLVLRPQLPKLDPSNELHQTLAEKAVEVFDSLYPSPVRKDLKL